MAGDWIGWLVTRWVSEDLVVLLVWGYGLLLGGMGVKIPLTGYNAQKASWGNG